VFGRIRRIYGEYPRNFWVVMGALFIDHLGGALIFPFLALFISAKFHVGMWEIGQLFAIVAISSIFGSMMGGALTDRLGRKAVIIFSLIVSAFSALSLGFVNDLILIYLIGLIVGLFANVGGPAQQAMIADLLPEEKRAEGFGLLRILINLCVTIGPAMGGIIAVTYSYLWLFIIDAAASTITALAVFFIIPETKPETPKDEPKETVVQTLTGYFKVATDRFFISFILVSILMVAVYVQMNTSLGLYLRDAHGISDQGYGYILTLNAAMVVAFQFWVTRRLKSIPPMVAMAIGTLFVGLGFSMYGLVSTYILFLAAMAVITIGEMLFAPVSQALVANIAPEQMRGRYMAMYGFAWTLPTAIAPLAAGYIMDNYSPAWVWYTCGIVSIAAVAGYLALHVHMRRHRVVEAEGPSITEETVTVRVPETTPLPQSTSATNPSRPSRNEVAQASQPHPAEGHN
jgi:MFS family permease